MRLASRLRSVLCLAASVASTACLTNALVTNLDDASCRSSVIAAISKILVAQREPPDVAGQLAADAVLPRFQPHLGRTRFSVSSPNGNDYTFVYRVKKEGCLLRLCARGKGRWTYINELTYFATEPLPGCACVAAVALTDQRHVGVQLR